MPDERTHRCIVCRAGVRQRLLMCPRDWSRVPSSIKRMVSTTHRTRATDPAAYSAAVSAAKTAAKAARASASKKTPSSNSRK